MYLSSSSQSYKGKYRKYKNKYQNLKNYLGGECELLPNPEEIDYISNENLLDLCPGAKGTFWRKNYNTK